MKIPFDVKYRPQIESGEYKVETRDGKSVRIICWDMKSLDGYSIIALVNNGVYELCFTFQNTGTFLNSGEAHGEDLFIITSEPELTEFECGMLRYLQDGANCKDDAEIIKETKKHSEYLLRYARKQIEAEKKQSKRLPTIKEWKWLINNCEWKWDNKRKGKIVTARNGNSIFLPAAGYRDGMGFTCDSSCGYYWSSSTHMDFPDNAYCVYFNSGDVDWDGGDRCDGYYVHPVSDTPQEGFIDMGNNLFWAEKNEEGYFTYDAVMKLFERGSH